MLLASSLESRECYLLMWHRILEEFFLHSTYLYSVILTLPRSMLEVSKVIAGPSLPRASGPLPAYSWTFQNAKQKLVVFPGKVLDRPISQPPNDQVLSLGS